MVDHKSVAPPDADGWGIFFRKLLICIIYIAKTGKQIYSEYLHKRFETL